MLPEHQRMLDQLWDTVPVVVIDFESCGPEPTTCEPVEVAAVRFENGKRVAGASSLIDPGCAIPAEAQAIHGITDDMVKGAPSLTEALLAIRFAELCEGAWPVGYNGQRFDRTILHRFVTGERLAATDPGAVWLDPLILVRHIDRFVSGSGRHRLAAACMRRGIVPENTHRADADAELTGRLLYGPDIQRVLRGRRLGEVLERQVIRAAEQEADFQAWLAKQPPREGAPTQT